MITQKSFEEIYESIRNNINDRDPNIDSKPGTFISDVFVCPQADELAAIYANLKLMELNQSPLLCTGASLDRIAHNYFTVREGSTYATGTIRFYINNTNRSNLTVSMVPEEIYIPSGFQVSTSANNISDAIHFTVREAIRVSASKILTLPLDPSIGYKYLETSIIAVLPGENGNQDANMINTMVTEKLYGILAVSNPLATTGGRDQENDESLRFRILKAVTGASICTKDGYLKYIIQQNNVNDALIVGGGDKIMFRDGGYLDASDTYRYGQGGMVDIWIRGQVPIEISTVFNITTTYLEKKTPDIIFDMQPVLSIAYVKSRASGYIYDNASNYDTEVSVHADNTTSVEYYTDVLWDFSITDTFPDVADYKLDIIDATEIELFKRKLDAELTTLLDEMSNLNYSVNWADAYEDEGQYTTLFKRISINNKIYKVVTKDSRLNGRTFVKKDNKIYERCYKKPDYLLAKQTYSAERYESKMGADVGNSVLAKDGIHWLKNDILQEGDILDIGYNYNSLIVTLQNKINNIRILTADILVRQAYDIPVQIILEAECSIDTTTESTRSMIKTVISNYINKYITMGSKLEESEIAALTRQLPGVEYVDLDTVSIAKKNSIAVTKLKLEPNEYFTIADINVVVNESN